MDLENDGISRDIIEKLHAEFKQLIGVQFDILSIPEEILIGFEPSQIGTMVGTLMDACIPLLSNIPTTNGLVPDVGLEKHSGNHGEREEYPDYLHKTGYRVELKLVFIENEKLKMKKPPTPREPSARLSQKVNVRNVMPQKDLLLVIAYRLDKNIKNNKLYTPTIVDIGLFPVIECVRARDKRMIDNGGKWFGNYETPTILSKVAKEKLKNGLLLDDSSYGIKQSEGKDYNEDTNFGKLKRIPYIPLQKFLNKHKTI